MKSPPKPKFLCRILLLFSAIILNFNLFSQSNPADIFSGLVSNDSRDNSSNYWLGNSNYKIKSISVGHDNDLFGLASGSLNKDESYTGGFQLQMTMSPILEKIFFRYQPETNEDKITYPRIDTISLTYINNVSIFEMGALAFTPFDIESSAVVEEDRPYASFHYLSFGLNSTILKKKKAKRNADGKERFMHRTMDSRFYLGTIGGYAAPVFQSFTHRFLDRETPNGWPNQIGGGKRRLAVNYNISQRFLATQSKVTQKYRPKVNAYRTCINASLHTVTDFNIGTYATNLGTGLRLHLFEVNRGARFDGNTSADTTTSANNFKNNLKDRTTALNDITKLANNWNFYIYGQAIGRAIIFDSMLQGTMFNDESVHTIDYRQMNPFRVDFSLGFALGINRKFTIYVDADYRSQEFLGGKKWHLFSRIGLNIRLD